MKEWALAHPYLTTLIVLTFIACCCSAIQSIAWAFRRKKTVPDAGVGQ